MGSVRIILDCKPLVNILDGGAGAKDKVIGELASETKEDVMKLIKHGFYF